MVPENIRKIPRPKNTIVQATKHENIYLVVQRVGCKYDNGRRLPVNGSVIGHIIDGVYVPKESGRKERLSQREAHLLKYGNVAFADSVGRDLYDSLAKVFHPDDARNIYVLALLRTAFGDIKDYQVEDKYGKSWAKVMFPNAAVSKSSVSKLLENLGKSFDLIVACMKQRLEETVKSGTKILIDGMLKNNNSTVNGFSGFSYKGRIKGAKDISIIAAIDAEKREPLCVKVYPGNLPDHANMEDFIKEFSVKNGIEISDKGFPLEAMAEQFKDKAVGFLHPIKRNRKTPDALNMYDNMVPVKTEAEAIMGSAAYDKDKRLYYYLFRDSKRAGKEERDFVSKKAAGRFDSKDYAMRRKKFGTICFVSNMRLELADVYAYYALRWEIETVFRMYKGILSLNTTRVHDDWSVVGTEFINYLSTIMICRMKNVLKEKELFKSYTFKDIMDRLADVIKVSSDKEMKKWELCSLNQKDKDLLTTLGV